MRTQTNVFIILWLLWHLGRPAYYYLAEENPLDERFAWRMFSDIDSGRTWMEMELVYQDGREEILAEKTTKFGRMGSGMINHRRNGVQDAAVRWICNQGRSEGLIIVRLAGFHYNVKGEQGNTELNLCEEVYCRY